jgi:hypothetical protein
MTTKHLLTGVAVVAALAFSAPVGAQVINPGNANPGGNAMGMPGPNPGGPALTPYSTGPAPTPSGANRMPAGGRATSGERIPSIMPAPPPSASDATSATPPTHRHARHARHVTHAAAHHKMAPLTGSTANQLNEQELARLQTGSSMPPPAAPMPGPAMRPQTQGGNSMAMPGPNTGGPGLTPYSTGTPQR